MTLQDLLDQLSFGELAQISIGGQPAGALTEANWPQISAHIRLALSALYTRFNLKEGRLVLQLRPNKLTYVLDSREDVRFVVGREDDEFADDLIKIERVSTPAGVDLPLNEPDNPLSCVTPVAKTLKLPLDLAGGGANVPEEFRTNTLKIRYRAAHKALNMPGGYLPHKYEMELPESHLNALILFVASRVNTPMGMTGDHGASHTGNNYFLRYEQECQRLENDGLEIDRTATNHRLIRNGWV